MIFSEALLCIFRSIALRHFAQPGRVIFHVRGAVKRHPVVFDRVMHARLGFFALTPRRETPCGV